MPSIKNFTPHSITLGGITYPSQGVARVSTTETLVGHIYRECPVHVDDTECGCGGLEVPIVRQLLGEVEGLPSFDAGALVIVSRMVAMACPDRSDLACPARLTRDGQGRVTGAEALESVFTL